MSKPMEQASFPVNAPGRVNPVSQGPHQASTNSPTTNDDLSMKHVGIAVGLFAILIGLFGYGFYAQQQGVTAKESEMKIVEVTTVPKPDASIMLSEASAQAAVPSTSPTSAVIVKEESIAAPGQIESVHADIYFDFGKTRLRADAIATLQQQAQILKQDGNWAVLIQGYTDRHGSIEYNKALALRRGESAKQFLTELGIPADSMKVVSLGQDAALCDDHTPTCKRLNRRVHLELVKLEAPAVSLTSAPTVSTKQESENSPTMTRGETASDQNNDAGPLTATPQSEATQEPPISSPESH